MRRTILGVKRNKKPIVQKPIRMYPYWRFLSEEENYTLEGSELRDVLYSRCTPKQYWMCLKEIDGQHGIFTHLAELRYVLTRAEYYRKKLKKAIEELKSVLEPYVDQKESNSENTNSTE